jgi:hypothetical protein
MSALAGQLPKTDRLLLANVRRQAKPGASALSNAELVMIMADGRMPGSADSLCAIAIFRPTRVLIAGRTASRGHS